jgi:Domain of unknown function (DUF1707)
MGSELDRFGNYRVGDAERAGTVDLLKEAHVAGYLTLADIDERLSAALAARTRADLERLLADLPPEWRARQEGKDGQVGRPEAPPERTGPPALRLLPLVVGLLIVAMVVLSVSRGFFFPWPLLWVWFIFGRGYRHRGGWRPPPGPGPGRTTWV